MVASTPINSVNARKPPRKIAIFVINIPDREGLQVGGSIALAVDPLWLFSRRDLMRYSST